MFTREELKGIWWEAVAPATVAEAIALALAGMAWVVLCALMSGA